jgi:hypothetical protein
MLENSMNLRNSISRLCCLGGILAIVLVQNVRAQTVEPTCGVGDCCNTGCDNCTGCDNGTGCDDCNDCTDWDCQTAGGFYAGVEATLLWADINGSPSQVGTFDPFGAPVSVHSSAYSDVGDGMTASPRLWLGYQGSGCWGVVGRYFDYRSTAMTLDPFAGPLDTLGLMSNNKLRAYNMDIEATRLFDRGCWSGNVSLGVRHASLNSTSSISSNSVVGTDLVSGIAMTDRQFNGTGLTFGFLGRRPIGCSGANFFINARGSMLWGNSAASAEAATSILTPLGAASDFQFAAAGNDEGELFIGEIQAGVEWEYELQCAPATAFLRLAGEFQYWEGDHGLNASAVSTSFAVPGATVVSAATAGDQQLDLFGVSLAAGISY